MSFLFRNLLEEGYYIDDGYGDFTKTDVPKLATHQHDGYCMNKIDKTEKIKDIDENISIFSHWKDDEDNDDVSMFSHWKD